jgi:hypothetical protein
MDDRRRPREHSSAARIYPQKSKLNFRIRQNSCPKRKSGTESFVDREFVEFRGQTELAL